MFEKQDSELVYKQVLLNLPFSISGQISNNFMQQIIYIYIFK